MKKSLLIVLAIAVGQISFGQIVYQYSGDDYYGVHDVDIDNDGYPEYKFNKLSNDVVVDVYNNNCIGKGANLIYFTDGQIIGSSTNWGCAPNAYSYIETGNGNKILGLKFYLGSNLHYGWLRIYPGAGGYTIWDWAYNGTPNASISAGQNTMGIHENESFQVTVTVLQGLLSVNVEQGDLGQLSLYSSSGQKIYGSQVMGHTATLDVSQFSAGIYFVEVGNSYRKIYIP